MVTEAGQGAAGHGGSGHGGSGRGASGHGAAPVATAVIGVGALGRHHARLMAQTPGARLVAVVDADAERARAVAEPLGAAALPSIEALPGEVRAVSVAVPTSSHHRIVMPLLERGLHVLVEKPMAATLVEAREMAALAQARRLVLQVGHVERFNPVLSVLRDLDVRPRFLQAERLAPFTYRALDVSVVMDLMIHDLDIVMELAGSPVERIDATGGAVLGKRTDIANARLAFANGCVANVTASRVSFEPVRKVRLFADRAYVSMDFSTRRAFVVTAAPGFRPASLSGADVARLPPKASFREFIAQGLLETREVDMAEANPLALELAAFLAAVRGETPAVGAATGPGRGRGAPPRGVSAEEGLRAMEAAERVEAAIAAHRWT